MLLSARLLIVSIFLIILGQLGIITPFRNLFHSILNPIQVGLYNINVAISNEADFISNISSMREENLKLREENTKLFSENIKFLETEAENKALRNQLNVAKDLDIGEQVMAFVVGRDPVRPGTVFLIDKGLSDGVGEGSVVVVENFLVGLCFEVSNNRCSVKLITDPTFLVPVLDGTSGDRARGVVRGSFGTKLVMEKILLDENIEVGDTIMTSGESDRFPKGLIVGRVSKILSFQSDVLKSAELDTLVDFSKIERVFVIVGKR